MAIRIVEESPSSLRSYATIPISFLVDKRFMVRPVDAGQAGLRLAIEPVEPPYMKDYDLDPGEGPANWGAKWDISKWGIFAAFDGDRRVGGAAIAWNTPSIAMLGARGDAAALWDIRVLADYRRQGVGSQLFAHAAAWARARGCTQLKAETQNVNVPACHFYARLGCTLASVDPLAYPGKPEEVQFIWAQWL
ncbi:MAG TPA: GNAT family N-acetyltransferase [Anaerolineales bacterium]|nr:GNAT family N-acetyltransferase [Anaerolineales bacterium]